MYQCDVGLENKGLPIGWQPWPVCHPILGYATTYLCGLPFPHHGLSFLYMQSSLLTCANFFMSQPRILILLSVGPLFFKPKR